MFGVSPENPDSARDQRPPSAATPAYLYHRQRRRRPGASDDDGGGRDMYRSAPQRVFSSNVITFSIVAGSMIALLVVGRMVAVISWNIKQERSVRSVSASSPDAPADYPVRDRTAAANGNTRIPGRPDETTDKAAVEESQTAARRADSLREEGNLEAAVAEYGRALTIWPRFTTARASLGRTYLQMKDYPRAQIALQMAMEDDPGEPGVINDLGVVQFRQQRFDRALKLFESALQMNPQFAEAHYNLALCHLRKSDRARAVEELERYVQLRPGDAKGLKERAFLAAASGNYTNAMGLLQSAMKTAPDWSLLYFDAAATAALMRNAEDAISYLKKAESLSSPAAAYLIYQQPAFQEIRATVPGQALLDSLAADAKARASRGQNDEPVKNEPEPMLSPPASGT
jgi:tetratricopeptide (TPR) repeat protein